jgi:hypothetical protein
MMMAAAVWCGAGQHMGDRHDRIIEMMRLEIDLPSKIVLPSLSLSFMFIYRR